MLRRACFSLFVALLPLALLFATPGNIASGAQPTAMDRAAKVGDNLAPPGGYADATTWGEK